MHNMASLGPIRRGLFSGHPEITSKSQSSPS
jgi:hypothetical protein